MSQSVEHPISAQVMILRFVSSSPASGPVLTAWSLEPASDSVSPPLSASHLLMLCLSLSLNNKVKTFNFFLKKKKMKGNAQSQIPKWYLYTYIFTKCFSLKTFLQKRPDFLYCDQYDIHKEVMNDLPYSFRSLPLRGNTQIS